MFCAVCVTLYLMLKSRPVVGAVVEEPRATIPTWTIPTPFCAVMATRAKVDTVGCSEDVATQYAIGEVNTHCAQDAHICLDEYFEAVERT